MSTTIFSTRRILVALLAGFLAAAGCTFDPWVWKSPGPLYTCPAGIYRYGRSTPGSPPKTGIQRPGGGALTWGALRASAALYSDVGWVAATVPGVVKGGWVLRLPAAGEAPTADGTKQDFQIQVGLLLDRVDRLWIAFDERAIHVPNWLANDFEPVTPEAALVSTQSYLQNGKPKRVRLRIWRPKAGHLNYLSQTHYLGGNDGAGASWPAGIQKAGYLLIVRLRPQPDRSTRLEKVATLHLKVHGFSAKQPELPPSQRTLDQAMLTAIRDWLARPANAKYRQAYADGLLDIEGSNGSCSRIQENVGGSSRALNAPRDDDFLFLGAWGGGASGEVLSSLSTATVTPPGSSPVTGRLRGRIDFTILDGNRAVVDNLSLWADDMTLGDGTAVTDLTVTQMRPFEAACADGLPHDPGRLCTRYEVAPGSTDGLLAGLVLAVDGHQVAGTLVNDRPLALDVDLDAMTFTFGGGPLTASLPVNGSTYTAEVSLSLGGVFTNLAPVASVAETSTSWECTDGGIAQVTLSATATTDELDPSDIAAYRWFEDRGTLAERALGSGATLTVPLEFGVHDLTLEVTDSHGSRSSRDFHVEVVDSRIDNVQPPPDLWVPVVDPSGTPVAVGTAAASDSCSGQVRITSDAPASGRFPQGFTPVTWTFDDLRGNLVRRVQRVFVVPAAYDPPPVSELELSASRVQPGQPLTVTHHCWPQGRGMLLDAYVLLRSPEGTVWSFDGTGSLVEGVVPHAASANLGAAPVTMTVHSGPLGSGMDGDGTYRVEAVLTAPGGDPLDRTQVLGWSEGELELQGF